MQDFYDLADLDQTEVNQLIDLANQLQRNPQARALDGKVLALLFLNPSLRTLTSMQASMSRLGGGAFVVSPEMSIHGLETRAGIVMDGTAAEHVHEAVPVISSYADVIGIRALASRENLESDLRDEMFQQLRRLCDVPLINLESASKHPCQALSKKQKRHQLDSYTRQKRERNLSASLSYSGFSNLDLVIEAVPEDQKIKKKIIAEASSHLKPSTIFATNTSSLSVKDLATAYPWPENFIGMHFFNPVPKMPLVEVIKTELASDKAVAVVFELARRLGKTPILVKDSPGFVVNRMLMPYLSEALWLLQEGCDIREVDHNFSHKFGFPMGPFRLMDEVGLDVCLKVMEVFHQAGLQVEIPKDSRDIMKNLGLGVKESKGFYVYDQGDIMEPNETLKTLQTRKRLCTPEVQVERGVYRLINEGFKVLDENVISSSEDLDLALILGMGFPPFLGGPYSYAKQLGFRKVRARLQDFTEDFGLRFKPHTSLN